MPSVTTSMSTTVSEVLLLLVVAPLELHAMLALLR
jgi:hypothetical protein